MPPCDHLRQWLPGPAPGTSRLLHCAQLDCPNGWEGAELLIVPVVSMPSWKLQTFVRARATDWPSRWKWVPA